MKYVSFGFFSRYDQENKKSGGSCRTNRPENDVLSVLSCQPVKQKISLTIDYEGLKAWRSDEKQTECNGILQNNSYLLKPQFFHLSKSICRLTQSFFA